MSNVIISVNQVLAVKEFGSSNLNFDLSNLKTNLCQWLSS